jgi:hypothetical protein
MSCFYDESIMKIVMLSLIPGLIFATVADHLINLTSMIFGLAMVAGTLIFSILLWVFTKLTQYNGPESGGAVKS